MTISRFYRILLALCGLVGVSIQIHDDGWGMLLYYTVLSNILVFSSLIFFIIYYWPLVPSRKTFGRFVTFWSTTSFPGDWCLIPSFLMPERLTVCVSPFTGL